MFPMNSRKTPTFIGRVKEFRSHSLEVCEKICDCPKSNGLLRLDQSKIFHHQQSV